MMFNFFLTLTLLSIVGGCIIYVYYWRQRDVVKFASKLSGPKTVFLFGNVLPFLMHTKQDTFDILCKVTAPFSSPVRLWIGPKLVVYLKSAENLQTVLQSSKITKKCYIYKFMEPFLGESLITGSGKAIRDAKKEYQVFFTQKMLEAYGHLYEKYAVKFVDEIKCHVNGEKFDAYWYFNNSSFESFLDITLEVEEFDTPEFHVAKTLSSRAMHEFYERLASPFLHLDFIYKRTKAYKAEANLAKIIKLHIEKLLKANMLEIAKRMENSETNQNCLSKRAPSMLELLIEMRKNDSTSSSTLLYKETDIDHIINLLAAYQETQSSTMPFTCMLLGMFPKIQDKVYAELIEVLDGRKSVDFRDAPKLKYLDMCLKEALRLFPSVAFVLRDTTENFELEDGLVIPENTVVMMSIFDVHRDPKHWEKPNDFYPEHFTPESIAKRHPFAFVPFSAGPRKCIAQQHAYVNMKIMLGTMLLSYVIESEEKLEDIRLKTDVSIRPINGYFIKIKKRAA